MNLNYVGRVDWVIFKIERRWPTRRPTLINATCKWPKQCVLDGDNETKQQKSKSVTCTTLNFEFGSSHVMTCFRIPDGAPVCGFIIVHWLFIYRLLRIALFFTRCNEIATWYKKMTISASVFDGQLYSNCHRAALVKNRPRYIYTAWGIAKCSSIRVFAASYYCLGLCRTIMKALTPNAR